VSVRATSWAWEHGRSGLIKGGELLTLLRIADHADNAGRCWPGEESLAEYTSQGDRTIRRHLVDLEAAGLLHRELVFRKEGRGRSYNGIFLHVDQPANLAARTSDVQPAISDASTGQMEHVQPAKSDIALIREPTTEPRGTNSNVDSSPDPVVDLFDFWKASTGRNGGTVLTPGRRSAVRARLDEGRTVAEVRRAIANVAASPFHQGKNSNKRRHDDLTLICRNGEKLEEYRDLGLPTPDAGTPASLATGSAAPIKETERATECWAVAKQRLFDGLFDGLPASRYRALVDPLEVAGERAGQLILVDTSGQGQAGRVAEELRGPILNALGGTFRHFEVIDETASELAAA
jgi:DNA-binding transcriptional ArsR family regulator